MESEEDPFEAMALENDEMMPWLEMMSRQTVAGVAASEQPSVAPPSEQPSRQLPTVDAVLHMEEDRCPASGVALRRAASAMSTCVAAAESSSMQDIASLADEREALWKTSIDEVLAPYAALRGVQKEKVYLSSACTGLNSEAKALELAGIDYKFLWTCDPKPESLRFQEANNVKFGHHFRCMRETALTGRGMCMVHDAACDVPRKRPNGKPPHAHKAGVSCRGFSTTNKYRLAKGAAGHEDSDLFHHWISQTKEDKPDEAMLENVFGMLIKSKSDTLAPLTALVNKAREELPMYDIVVYFFDCILYLVLKRRRLFVHAMHVRVGGAEAHTRMTSMLKVFCF